MYNKIRIIAVILISSALLASCATMVEDLIQPGSTPTLIDEPILYGEVTFKDGECTVVGPEEVERGIYYFTLSNESDHNLDIWLNQLLEGKTFDDLVSWQEEPGVYLPPPPWIVHPFRLSSGEVESWLYHLDQVGEYAVLIGDNNMTVLWFCDSFSVVEVSTD